jgi:hypothetical protein
MHARSTKQIKDAKGKFGRNIANVNLLQLTK